MDRESGPGAVRVRSVLLLCLVLTGCASGPTPLPQDAAHAVRGQAVAAVAEDLLGAPYRSGGTSPRGLDCSGLVQYAHARAGIAVPRTAAAQFRSASRVSRTELRQGDVVFFRGVRGKVSHVGIYQGSGRFIHVAASRRRVTASSLSSPYWERRFAGAGRFY